MEGPKLTVQQITDFKNKVGENPISERVSCRFLYKGQNLNITTGELLPKGCNIIYQHHYTCFSKSQAKEMSALLKVKVVMAS